MIRFVGDKDIFEVNADVYVNPVNCVGVMGAGLAKEFKRRFPDMFALYKLACDAEQLKPGTLNVYETPLRITREVYFPHTIVNLPTKVHWKEKSTLDNVLLGLVSLAEHLRNNSNTRSVAIPKLGCGLGGLEWKDVCRLVVIHMSLVPCEVIVLGDRVV